MNSGYLHLHKCQIVTTYFNKLGSQRISRSCIGDLTMEHLNILRVITIVLFIELPHEFPLKQALNVSMEIL